VMTSLRKFDEIAVRFGRWAGSWIDAGWRCGVAEEAVALQHDEPEADAGEEEHEEDGKNSPLVFTAKVWGGSRARGRRREGCRA